MSKRKTTEQFIEEAKKIWGDKYDYSKVDYVNAHTKVCIICPKHGEFLIAPNHHLFGKACGCPKCGFEISANKQKQTTDQFIEKCRKVYGDKYDYSKVDYVNARTKVCIICPEHGEFWQKPYNHLCFNKFPCPDCNKNAVSARFLNDNNWFIEKAKSIHGDKYDYSKVDYQGYHTKVCIICPEHGEFWQLASVHICNKSGCPKCMAKINSERNKLPFKCFLKKAKKVHGDKYEYDESTYVDTQTRFRIICPEHGEFWQLPTNHYKGAGCPVCKSSRGEAKIKLFLEEKTNEDFFYQYYSKWLEGQSLDFFFPKYNFGIEYDGEQHFFSVNFGGHMSEEQMDENLKKTQERDRRKNEKCAANGIKLYRIKYDEDVIESLTKILKEHNIEIIGDKQIV